MIVSKCVRKFHKECCCLSELQNQPAGNEINLVKTLGFAARKNVLAANWYKERGCAENGVVQSCHLRAVKIVDAHLLRPFYWYSF